MTWNGKNGRISEDAPVKPVEVKPAEPGEQPKPVDTSARVLGLDVAKYQDKLDPSEWARLFAMGYRFAFIKATDGLTGKDAYYEIHRKNAKAAGFIVGAYHFLRYGYDPLAQAAHFFKTAGRVTGELPPTIDVEWDRYTTGMNGKSYGENKRMDDWAETHAAYCAKHTLTKFGVRPIIYTNAYFWPEKVTMQDFWKLHTLWVPSYADSLNPGGVHHIADLSPAEIALAGKGVKMPHPWKQWNFWQDDDDLAIGDVKAIDTNVYRGSLEDLRKLASV